MKTPAVYILASKPYGTLYIGVTSDLYGRIHAHKDGIHDGFTKRYGVKTLVYFEMHETMEAAIAREKRLKGWNRAWKIRLIEQINPEWKDLYNAGSGEITEGETYTQRLEAEPDPAAGLYGVPPSRD